MIVLLDSGPLGILAHPVDTPASHEALDRALDLISVGHRILVPEVADYEVRREMVRSGSTDGVERLEGLGAAFGYLPLTTDAWHRAAGLWADARRRHRPTAADHALDGDVLLAAQAQDLATHQADDVVVATSNVQHLGRYVTAQRWDDL